MKVLVIGSGGREHAIADAFSRSSKINAIIVSPGNAGIAQEYRCEKLGEFSAILDFCHQEAVDLVFIGPEQPIQEGLSDYLREHEIKVLAPSRLAARLETSKFFAKQIMFQHQVTTAKYVLISDQDQAADIIADFNYPVVLKADGLAAGKGVIICSDELEAKKACADLFGQSAGKTGILAEEYLSGWEVSLFAFCDGQRYLTSLFAQDHKQLYEQDQGPNTGGMGAICPVPQAEEYRSEIETQILEPVLKAMNELGCPYQGILYLGLMITNQGPKVIEFNCRLGDPETQVLLPLLKTDFLEICLAIIEHRLPDIKLEWEEQTAITVVLAAPGYPGKYKKGIAIDVPKLKSKVFFAGVQNSESGLISSGGRVLAVMNKADTLKQARASVYQDIEAIRFADKVYRKDIGQRTNLLK